MYEQGSMLVVENKKKLCHMRVRFEGKCYILENK